MPKLENFVWNLWLGKMSDQDEICLELLKALKIDRSGPSVLTKLLENNVNTWGALLGLENKDRLVEKLGNNLVPSAHILWSEIEQYKRSLAKPKLPLHEATEAFLVRKQFETLPDFVPPDQFNDMLYALRSAMTATTELEGFRYVACTGPIAVGTTTCGQQLISQAWTGKKELWYPAYFENIEFFPKFNCQDCCDDELCKIVLALVLCEGFGLKKMHKFFRVDLEGVEAKIKQDFEKKEVHVLLQIDNFARNPEAVSMILHACSLINNRAQPSMKIVPVVTGSGCLAIDLTNRPHISHFVLVPWTDIQIQRHFAAKIGLSMERLNQLIHLKHLVDDCGGHPALINILAEIVGSQHDLLQALKENRWNLELRSAYEIYDAVSKKALRYHFQYCFWEFAWRLPSVEGGDATFSRNLLFKVYLEAILGVPVQCEDVIAPEVHLTLTYAEAEARGLIMLKNHYKLEHSMQVTMPLVTITCLVETFKDEIRGVILKNPYTATFQDLEEMCTQSLQLIFLLKKLRGETEFPCNELRPSSMFGSRYLKTDDLIIKVPKNSRIFQIRGYITPEADLSKIRIGDAGENEVQGIEAGDIFLCAKGQPAIDAIAVMEGKVPAHDNNFEDCWIHQNIQGKSKEIFLPGKIDRSKNPLQTAKVTEVVKSMGKVDYYTIEWVTINLSARSELGVALIRDLVTNREAGQRLAIDTAALPSECLAACMVTTENSVVECLGVFITIRERMKRVFDESLNDAIEEEQKKTKKSEEKKKKTEEQVQTNAQEPAAVSGDVQPLPLRRSARLRLRAQTTTTTEGAASMFDETIAAPAVATSAPEVYQCHSRCIRPVHPQGLQEMPSRSDDGSDEEVARIRTNPKRKKQKRI